MDSHLAYNSWCEQRERVERSIAVIGEYHRSIWVLNYDLQSHVYPHLE